LYPINVKTAEPIKPKTVEAAHKSSEKVQTFCPKNNIAENAPI